MDITLSTLTHYLFSFFMTVLEGVGHLEPKTAFVIGALTWFTIEVSVRKISNILRITIIVMILASTSVAAFNLFA